jgi:hypothetical protein
MAICFPEPDLIMDRDIFFLFGLDSIFIVYVLKDLTGFEIFLLENTIPA